MRNQIAAAERAGIRARTINSANAKEWDAGARRRCGGRGRRAAGQPRAVEQPAFPATAYSRPLPPKPGSSSSTRRTASPTGATTSAPTTAASARCSADLPQRHAGTRDDRDREQAGDRRRQRATRHGRPSDSALVLRGSLDRESLHLAVLPLPSNAHRLAWLADHLRELTGIGRDLHPDGRAGGGGRGLPGRAWACRPALHRAHGERRPSASPRRVTRQPGQGAGCHLSSRYGFRQARPRIHRPFRRTAITDRLLPAGRPRRSRRRPGGRPAPARMGGRSDLALLRQCWLPGEGSGSPHAGRAG